MGVFPRLGFFYCMDDLNDLLYLRIRLVLIDIFLGMSSQHKGTPYPSE